MSWTAHENDTSRPPPRSLSGRRLSVSSRNNSSSRSFSSHGNLNGNGVTSRSSSNGFASRSTSGSSIGGGSRNVIHEQSRPADETPPPPPPPPTGGFPPIRYLQNRLDFRGCDHLPQFSHASGLGRVATLASILGAVLSVHVMVLLQIYLHEYNIVTISVLDTLNGGTIQLLQQWVSYVIILTSFHVLEFFITALYNPMVTTADSFVINQSMAYTTAAIVSWVEFWLRFAFCQKVNSPTLSCVGFALVVVGQIVRASAMVTCGESFNHLIQQTKKDNHVLITHGIYKYFRHPSYVGFYYWSIGTQLLLGNPLSFVCYVVASWFFFKKRIPYEEETLVRYFPDDYPVYVASTWSGLPFIWSGVVGKDDGSPPSSTDEASNHQQEVSFSADGFKKLD